MRARRATIALGLWLLGFGLAHGNATPVPLFTPAPMPDLTLEPPPARATPQGPTLTPNLYGRPQAVIESDGYTRGSAMQYDEPRANQFRPSPGLQLRVPLN